MPLARISHVKGKSPEYRRAISLAVQRSLEETFSVVPEDFFQIITEHAPGTELVHPPKFLDWEYSDEIVFIQITCNNWRTADHKRALYAAIRDKLIVDPGLRKDDIIVSIIGIEKENWSFGGGELSFP